MSIELINNKNPLTIRIGIHRLFNVFDKIFLGTRVADGRMNDSTRRDFKIRDQGLRAVSFITMFASLATLDFRFHRLCRMQALQRLYPRLFVGADDMNALLMPFGSILIESTDRLGRVLERFRTLFWGVEPIPGFVRLETSGLEQSSHARG